MNRTMIEATRNLIARHADQFAMDEWVIDSFGSTVGIDLENECGSAGCIAAWACIAGGMHYLRASQVFDHGRDVLGLTYAEAMDLFIPSGDSVWGRTGHPWALDPKAELEDSDTEPITADDAVHMLDKILAGEVVLEKRPVRERMRVP